MDYKMLWLELIKFFETTNQTGWGKNQIVTLMKERELQAGRED